MILDHTHEFCEDSTIDTEPDLSLETSQDEVPADSEVPSVASGSKVDSFSSELTRTDLGSDYSNYSPSHRVFGYESDESDPVALDDMNGSEDDEVDVGIWQSGIMPKMLIKEEDIGKSSAKRNTTGSTQLENIKSLADEEKRLAVEYGMAKFDSDPRRIDPVAVLEETKYRAMMSELDGSAHPWDSFHKLHKLHHLHTEAVKLKPFPPSKGTPHRIDASGFWAIIIGIDAYRTHPLHGCVADALLMKRYLEKDLRVPSNHIQLLLGMKDTSCHDPSYPSRRNITNTLCSLISNPNIKKGDNIVIYFAGHGSSYGCSQCPGAIRTRKSIVPDAVYATRTQGDRHGAILCPTEAICPIDRSLIDTNGSGIITDISDRELNTYLYEISWAKGNKITAIFDCCHSSSISRGERSEVRSALPLNGTRDSMLRVGMQNLKCISNRPSIMDKWWCPDMSSHVILAACKSHEFAEEVEEGGKYHGYFTDILVKTLRSGSWMKELTYDGLLYDLPETRRQTPVVAGDFRHERLWYQTA
ncbi:caspase domain-containing protein [Armillaria mellea]|nr:caspase domain-containing protein [Armillaria mellea]